MEKAVGLYEFTHSDVAVEAELLARRVLAARVDVVRRQADRYYDELDHAPVEAFPELASGMELPPVLLGAGAVSTDAGDFPLIVAHQAALESELPEGEVLPIHETEEIAWRTEQIGGFPSETRVLVVSTPEFHFEPGAEVRCSGLTGTLGTLVTSAGGNDAILTAGHAAPGGVARDALGNTGQVRFSADPARIPASAVTVDVAVIETTHTAPGPPISGQGTAQGRDRITMHGGKSGTQQAEVFAYCQFLNTPLAAGEWTDVYLTSAGISQRGDSGAPVLKDGTGEIVGHLVGGSGTTTSYIQDVNVQLKACGATLR